MSKYITRFQFLKLIDLLKEQVKSKYEITSLPEEYTELLGISKFEKTKGAYIRNLLPEGLTSANYLYNRVQIFENPYADAAMITEEKINKILHVTGYTWSSFKKKCEQRDSSINYYCLYYSFIDAIVKKFPLSFVKYWDGHLGVEAHGFHNHADHIHLTGSYKLMMNDTLVLNLEKDTYYLNLLLQTHGEMAGKSDKLPLSKMLQGIINTPSANKYTIKLECILLHEELYANEEERIHAERYLTLKRMNHRVKSKETSSNTTKLLEINHIRINEIADMAGNSYRIWNYSFNKKNIYQSRFTVNKDYTADIKTPNDSNSPKDPFTCHITINNNAQLLINAYRNSYVALTCILNIPGNNNSVVPGVFCTVGKKDKKLGANYFVMVGDNSDFGVGKFDADNIDEIPAEDAVTKSKLKNLKKELDNLPAMISLNGVATPVKQKTTKIAKKSKPKAKILTKPGGNTKKKRR